MSKMIMIVLILKNHALVMVIKFLEIKYGSDASSSNLSIPSIKIGDDL